MNKLTTLADFGIGEDPDFYWLSKLATLPNDIKRYIKVLCRSDKEKIIEMTKKLYELMERDTHSEDFKPFYAFAKLALSYTRRRE